MIRITIRPKPAFGRAAMVWWWWPAWPAWPAEGEAWPAEYWPPAWSPMPPPSPASLETRLDVTGLPIFKSLG